jgi:starch synthase
VFKLNVLFVASEAVPFLKTGGLADVIGALPKELKNKAIVL